MRCPRCHALVAQPASTCDQCGATLASRAPSYLAGLLIVLALLAGLGLYMAMTQRQTEHLAIQSGEQWDSEMTGPWVHTSPRSESGVEIYRIHIKNQDGKTLGPDRREFHPGDKVVVAFHFRTQFPGSFQPRVVVEGPSPVSVKKVPALTVDQGDFGQFKGILIPFALPPETPPGDYLIRLEVEDTERGRKGFWETDFQVR